MPGRGEETGREGRSPWLWERRPGLGRLLLLLGPQLPPAKQGDTGKPLATCASLAAAVSRPLRVYLQTRSQEGRIGDPDRPENGPLRAEGLTWLLGSQGTERGISACLQDTMYFLGEREDNNLGPLGAHRLHCWLTVCQALCAAQRPGRDSCLARETGWAHRQQQLRTYTLRGGDGLGERCRPPTPLLSDFTLAKATSLLCLSVLSCKMGSVVTSASSWGHHRENSAWHMVNPPFMHIFLINIGW